MVIEGPRPIAEVARDLGINESTLGNWVTKYRDEHPASEDLNISDRTRLKELEKENRELRMERDFLKKPQPSSPRNNEREFELIAAEKADPTSRCPVIKMCAWLGVSTSGFYDHCNAVETDRARRRTKIITRVQA